jgi:hypothetical protein
VGRGGQASGRSCQRACAWLCVRMVAAAGGKCAAHRNMRVHLCGVVHDGVECAQVSATTHVLIVIACSSSCGTWRACSSGEGVQLRNQHGRDGLCCVRHRQQAHLPQGECATGQRYAPRALAVQCSTPSLRLFECPTIHWQMLMQQFRRLTMARPSPMPPILTLDPQSTNPSEAPQALTTAI